jgi:hypothetical protein
MTLKGYWFPRPGIYGASTGLVSTVANTWGVQHGNLSAANKLSLFVTGGATGFFIILWVVYKQILLENAKKKHIDEAGHYGLGQNGEGRTQVKGTVGGTGEREGMFADVLSGPFGNSS